MGFDALRRQVPVRYSVRGGKVIASTKPAQTTVYLGSQKPSITNGNRLGYRDSVVYAGCGVNTLSGLRRSLKL
ncbi:hypothetical protein [Escherichia coli]|uniref:hypothetical protein n=1 Tax=Escherichia coli TaxID=562 RepID=UPI00388D70CB